MADIVYTRSFLKSLRSQEDYNRYQQDLERILKDVRRGIIEMASDTNNTTFYYNTADQTRTNPKEISYIQKVCMDAVSRLREVFIDVSIDYKICKCNITGRVLNEGIYADWS